MFIAHSIPHCQKAKTKAHQKAECFHAPMQLCVCKEQTEYGFHGSSLPQACALQTVRQVSSQHRPVASQLPVLHCASQFNPPLLTTHPPCIAIVPQQVPLKLPVQRTAALLPHAPIGLVIRVASYVQGQSLACHCISQPLGLLQGTPPRLPSLLFSNVFGWFVPEPANSSADGFTGDDDGSIRRGSS